MVGYLKTNAKYTVAGERERERGGIKEGESSCGQLK